MVDNLGDLKQEIHDLKRRLRVLESASPLGYSSITEGALEIRSEEGLIVEGSARVSGVLLGDGTFRWSGPWELIGNGEVSGSVDVVAGGKIRAGNMVIDPGDHDGMITLPNGAQLLANDDAVEVWSPGPVRRGISITAGAIRILNPTPAASTAGLKMLAINPVSGEVFSVDPPAAA